MVNVALQRENMVESQVRPSDVTDRRVIRAMQQVPREAFVPPALKTIAYADEALRLPLGSGGGVRVMLPPRTFAKLIQLTDLASGDVVLDVGCGLGYSSAVIARIAQTVVALEESKAVADEAQKALAAQAIDNVAVVAGPLQAGYPEEGPYDAIVIEGAVEEVPDGLLDQLKDGGRLAAIVIEDGVGRAAVWRRLGQTFDRMTVFDAQAHMLQGFNRQRGFVF